MELEQRITAARNAMGEVAPPLSRRMVRPVGNPASGLVLMGDYPTIHENDTGNAMAGVAYDVVREAFAGVDAISTRSAYLTHLCKFAPVCPDASLSVHLVARFKALALEELRKVKPKVVVLLGSKAAAVMCGRSAYEVKSSRGTALPFSQVGKETKVIVTYNPKALLRFHDQILADYIMLDIQRGLKLARREEA